MYRVVSDEREARYSCYLQKTDVRRKQRGQRRNIEKEAEAVIHEAVFDPHDFRLTVSMCSHLELWQPDTINHDNAETDIRFCNTLL